MACDSEAEEMRLIATMTTRGTCAAKEGEEEEESEREGMDKRSQAELQLHQQALCTQMKHA